MLRFEGTTIELNRGEACTITLKCKTKDNSDPFHSGDIVSLGVYLKKGLDQQPLLMKETIVQSETDTVDISLLSNDTKIGEMSNKPIDYWYEIELNHAYTIIGYDKSGEKVFRVYPEGAELK